MQDSGLLRANTILCHSTPHSLLVLILIITRGKSCKQLKDKVFCWGGMQVKDMTSRHHVQHHGGTEGSEWFCRSQFHPQWSAADDSWSPPASHLWMERLADCDEFHLLTSSSSLTHTRLSTINTLIVFTHRITPLRLCHNCSSFYTAGCSFIIQQNAVRDGRLRPQCRHLEIGRNICTVFDSGPFTPSREKCDAIHKTGNTWRIVLPSEENRTMMKDNMYRKFSII